MTLLRSANNQLKIQLQNSIQDCDKVESNSRSRIFLWFKLWIAVDFCIVISEEGWLWNEWKPGTHDYMLQGGHHLVSEVCQYCQIYWRDKACNCNIVNLAHHTPTAAGQMDHWREGLIYYLLTTTIFNHNMSGQNCIFNKKKFLK